MENKIATIDCETYPATVLMYGNTFEPVIVKQVSFEVILSCSIKINDGPVKYYGLDTMPGYKKGSLDDRELLKKISPILNSVDYRCGHNSDDFDIRKIKERLIFHRLPPLADIPSLDTKKLYKQVSKLPNNKLNTISQFNGIGEKIKHEGVDLFIACGEGDPKAWAKNRKYNKHDVLLTWENLKIVLPYVKLPHARQLNAETMNCPSPTCGGKMYKSKLRNRVDGKVQQWQCGNCGRYHTPNKIVKNEK